MNIGEIIELDIQSNGISGEGVARCDNKVVFVPYTLKGERVRAKITEVKKKYANASVIKILAPSEYRITPTCPHYYKCGGCDMGHIAPEYRREVLIAELKNNLKKIAEISGIEPEFVTVDNGNTRNKLSMPFGICNGKAVVGLYRQNTHKVEPVACAFASALMQKTVDAVCDFANAKRLSVYDQRSGAGLLRHIVMREIGGRASATLVINGDGFDGEAELGELLPECVDLFVCPNTRPNNVIMGESVRLIKGEPRLKANVLGVKAMLSPLSFFQVNDSVRDALYSCAISNIKSPVLIDLYSGIGITSNLAAKNCKKVIAVECVPQAVKDADGTAALNGNADKIKNICGNVENVLDKLGSEVGADVLVDPPRKGCGSAVMDGIAKIKPARLIYISCNHATMCRDIRSFLDTSPDYDITEAKIFDMFPNTHHVETLVCLTRK